MKVAGVIAAGVLVAAVLLWTFLGLTAWTARTVHDTITNIPALNPSPSPDPGYWIPELQGDR